MAPIEESAPKEWHKCDWNEEKVERIDILYLQSNVHQLKEKLEEKPWEKSQIGLIAKMTDLRINTKPIQII